QDSVAAVEQLTAAPSAETIWRWWALRQAGQRHARERGFFRGSGGHSAENRQRSPQVLRRGAAVCHARLRDQALSVQQHLALLAPRTGRRAVAPLDARKAARRPPPRFPPW